MLKVLKVRSGYLPDNSNLPNKCPTQYCPGGSNKQLYWRQTPQGKICCILCGAQVGFAKPGILKLSLNAYRENQFLKI